MLLCKLFFMRHNEMKEHSGLYRSSVHKIVFYLLFFFLIFFVGTTAYAQGNMFVIFCKPVEIIGLTFFVLCLSLALYLIVIALFKCLFKWNNTLFNMRSILFTIFISLLLSLIYVTSQEILFVASCFQVHRAHTVGSIVKIQEETDKYQPRWWPNGDSCLGWRKEDSGQWHFWVMD